VHAPKNFGTAFAIGIALNLGFVIVEVIYGLLANSMALVADAGHNLGDVLGLVMAWIATLLARHRPSQTYTYGLRRGTILAALANAVLLLVTVGAIAVEGMRRLISPGEVASVTVMVVAAVGISKATLICGPRSCTWPMTHLCRGASWLRAASFY
jgi:cobalt-zinc-cadmium efflux system protein